jgi:alpha-beta hydrolase superfamily lysophospholipase
VADYSQIDQSPLMAFLFYPRKDFTPCPPGSFDLQVPVGGEVSIGCRFYTGDKRWPWILYFHGNGEITYDYDQISPFYHQKEINLVVADYRGYGSSTGLPNFTNLLNDAPILLKAVREELAKKNLKETLWVMGRSMGSLSAVELARGHPQETKGIIIESGFASVTRLVRHLHLPSGGLDLEPLERERMAVLREISLPALIIHGELDMLVPLQEGKDLFETLGSSMKKLVVIPGGDHNTLMFAGLKQYFAEIREFIDATGPG